jgi:hypothetical protein
LNSDSTDSKVVALTVLAHLDPSSVMQFVQIVEQLSTHPSLNVRAKAAAVLHRLYLARRDVPVSSLELVRKFLADEKYPIVSAGLRILETRSRQDVSSSVEMVHWKQGDLRLLPASIIISLKMLMP